MGRSLDELDPPLEDLRAADTVTIHPYDGAVSAMPGRFDDVATIVPLDDAGVPCAIIESDAPAVRTALDGTLDRYRARAHRLSEPAQSPSPAGRGYRPNWFT
jgi:hypothetical protein